MICPNCKSYVRNKPYIESVFDGKGNQIFTCRKCRHTFSYEEGKKVNEEERIKEWELDFNIW